MAFVPFVGGQITTKTSEKSPEEEKTSKMSRDKKMVQFQLRRVFSVRHFRNRTGNFSCLLSRRFSVSNVGKIFRSNSWSVIFTLN